MPRLGGNLKQDGGAFHPIRQQHTRWPELLRQLLDGTILNTRRLIRQSRMRSCWGVADRPRKSLAPRWLAPVVVGVGSDEGADAALLIKRIIDEGRSPAGRADDQPSLVPQLCGERIGCS